MEPKEKKLLTRDDINKIFDLIEAYDTAEQARQYTRSASKLFTVDLDIAGSVIEITRAEAIALASSRMEKIKSDLLDLGVSI